MNNLDDIINNLKESPLFYLFLSSRELFHTNFWYWLSTLNKYQALRLFYNDDIKEDNLTFKREYNQKLGDYKSQVDLLISSPSKHLVVIENKIKDFPTSEQLERIINSFGNQNIEYVLTTLFSYPNLRYNRWTIKTYEDLYNSIIPESFTNVQYYKDLINDYKNLIHNLDLLAKNLPLNTNYDFAISFQKHLFKKLNEIRLWEAYQKMRASHLLNNFGIRKREHITCLSSINHQKATIDFFISLPNEYRIGVQLENNQFRKFVYGDKAEIFAKSLIDKIAFFNNQKFLRYGFTFKYQYKILENPLTFIELFSKIDNELDYLMKNIESIKANIP